MRRNIGARHLAGALGLALALTLPANAIAGTYEIDRSHTTVRFMIRHLFTETEGRFGQFEGRITFDPNDPASTKIEGTIDAASIDTDNEKRDKHLRSADFFDVEKYPKITFTSTEILPDAGGKKGKVKGKLNMHGVEKEVTLDVKFLGQGKDPWGNVRAGFKAETEINRKDFGLGWNETLETGGLLVGEEVTIAINAEALVK